MRRSILLLFALLCVATASAKVICGAERVSEWLPLLEGRRVALLANHTSTVGDEHLLDVMVARGVKVVAVISPEHGFRGTADAGEKVASSVDTRTGIPVWSLYAAKSRRLTAEQVAEFDVVVVDMQDVGLRFYTYYITMLSVMRSAAEGGKEVVVFDRPNPNGMYVDGPILDMERYRSGVGALPIPVLHGMTMGELAGMAVGEGWCPPCPLRVVLCRNYTHSTPWSLPVAPSPNLKSDQAVALYPSLCLFEGTKLSVGRGTDHPFECFGHPALKGVEGFDFCFIPEDRAGAHSPVLEGQSCYGVDLREVEAPRGLQLDYLVAAYRAIGGGDDFFRPIFEKLIGTDRVRRMVIQGASADEIEASWRSEVEAFLPLRKRYLLYAE
jgi:uncharacterized protein YbbC (DUF1343 family)